MERKLIARNIGTSLALQIVTMISGFVIPKVILSYFGSDVNGLISSINQFLNYIQLLEGGLSGVIMAALYKPLADGDMQKISAVINATRSFFRKLSAIYVVYMAGVAVVYPLVVKTGFSYAYSVALVVVLGLHLFVQYFFSLTYKLLLNADRKVYFVSLTQIIIVGLNMALVVICAKLFNDVLIIKIASALIFFIQPLMYGLYVKKHFKLDKTVPPDNKALSQRWDGFGINLAYFVHTNTDVIILTIFSTLAEVSVYSVYLMVINAMKNLVMAVSQAIIPSFGKVLVSDNKEEINKKFELYELGMYLLTAFVFTCGMFLITPFIRVYTANIHDADYNRVVFGYLLTAAEMVYCFRDPYIAATYAAGHFKQVTKFAFTEVVINLAVSLALVKPLGITGVAIGTLVSMIYRQVSHVFYLKKNILYRSPVHFFKKAGIYGLSIASVLLISIKLLNDDVSGYIGWGFLAVKEAVICGVIIFAVTLIFYREPLKKLIGNKLKFKSRGNSDA